MLKQIRILKQQGQKLRAVRDLLLPRLMSGEITVRQPHLCSMETTSSMSMKAATIAWNP